jgi:flagellar basal body-associated protein FliL
MKIKVFIAILLVCSLVSVEAYGAWAQNEGALGVKPGDNFTYSFVAFWSSTDQSQIVPQEFSNLNKTLSIHFNITDASSITAYVNITKLNRDGTQVLDGGFINVVTGRGVEAQLFIIQANLTAGDKAYPESDPAAVASGASAESFTISDTTTLTYLGVSREVNHYHESKTDSDGSVIRDAYFDKTTGVLLELTISHSFVATPGEEDSEHWKITQFNSAVGPSDGSDGTNSTGSLPDWVLYALIVVIVVIIVALVAMFILRGRKGPDIQEPDPMPAETQPPS